MRLVWVKGNTLFSRLIMWALDEPVSHFAVVFDDRIVFHSDLLGVRLAWFQTFLKNREIIHEINFPSTTLDMEEEVYQSIITKFDGSSYDYKAFLYFTWRALLYKFFKVPFPVNNAWGSRNHFLCEEVAGILPDNVVPPEVKQKDLGMLSPYKLWLVLKEYYFSK